MFQSKEHTGSLRSLRHSPLMNLVKLFSFRAGGSVDTDSYDGTGLLC